METFKYKDFVGSIETSVVDNCLFGKILHITDIVTYQADNLKDLHKEFKEAVGDYIETCEELEIEPQKSFSGTFNVRIGGELHKKAAIYGVQKDMKINAVVVQAIEQFFNKSESVKEIHNHTHNYTSSIPFEVPTSKHVYEDNLLFSVKLGQEIEKCH